MKSNNSLKLSLIFLCLFTKPLTAVWADVEAYFLPQNLTAINERLSKFVDAAKSELLVTSFYLTDQNFIDKLIELKKRGVDVQVIFDSNSTKRSALIKQLTDAGIVPVVSFFRYLTSGIMHNKFLVCDKTIWTGSANFTAKAFRKGKNYENVMTVTSAEIAQQYKANFLDIEKEIFQSYVDVLLGKRKKKVRRDVCEEIQSLACELYKTNKRFQTFLQDNPKMAQLLQPAPSPNSDQENNPMIEHTLTTVHA